MDNKQIEYEQYEDALFAQIMDKVAEMYGEELLRENEKLRADPNVEFPEDLNRRCLEIIRGIGRNNKE